MHAFLKVPTRLHYGLILASYLARTHKTQTPVSLRDISLDTGISQGYLEEIVVILRSRKLVRSKRGYGGGYIFARDPKTVRVTEIVEAFTGPIAFVECLKDASLSRCIVGDDLNKKCTSKLLWFKVQQKLIATMDTITLSHLTQ